MSLTFATASVASTELNVIVPYPPGGGLSRMLDVKTALYQSIGQKITVDYNRICNVGMEKWNNLKPNQKSLFVTGAGAVCVDKGFNPSELVGVNYVVNFNLCAAKRPGKSLSINDFLDKTKTKTVAMGHPLAPHWLYYFNSLGLKDSAKVILYDNTGATHTAFLSNDIDYVVTQNDWTVKNSDKVECIISATADRNENWPNAKLIKDLLPPNSLFTTHQAVYYMSARGYSPAEMQQLRQTHEQIKRMPEWRERVTVPGTLPMLVPFDKQVQLVQQAHEVPKLPNTK